MHVDLYSCHACSPSPIAPCLLVAPASTSTCSISIQITSIDGFAEVSKCLAEATSALAIKRLKNLLKHALWWELLVPHPTEWWKGLRNGSDKRQLALPALVDIRPCVIPACVARRIYLGHTAVLAYVGHALMKSIYSPVNIQTNAWGKDVSVSWGNPYIVQWIHLEWKGDLEMVYGATHDNGV
jgi:hypothetical protein